MTDLEVLEAALQDTDAMIEDKRAALRRLSAEIEALETERKGLDLAVSRRRPKQGPASEPLFKPVVTMTWEPMTRLNAIVRVLEQATEPMSPTEIVRQLRAYGRQGDTPNYVAAALSQLKREKKVHSVGRAQWVAGPDPSEGDQGDMEVHAS